MRFNPRAKIGSGNVRDAGGSGGSRSGISLPGGLAGVGGGGGVVILIVFVLIQVLGNGGGGTSDNTGTTGTTGTDRYAACEDGADANENEDCARQAVAVSLADYWSTTLPEQGDTSFVEAPVTTFTGQISTACGTATSSVGPFYCPGDQGIYLDSSFFTAVLQDQLGGSGGDFVEPYVLAHEYGHHIQNLLGTMDRVRSQQGEDSDAVRLELQADCYAGMWADAAATTEDSSGVRIFESIDDADISEALDAAATVGDDRIQEQTQGQVNPETWTHGSAEQRQHWFNVGYAGGDLNDCDTFATDDL